MLFSNHIATVSNSIDSIQNRIDELEAQLKVLRADKSTLEAELQTVLTLEGAAESAINQAQSFIGAAESLHRPDLIATFWQAMATLQNGPVMGQLPPAPTAETETEPTTPITPPPAPSSPEPEQPAGISQVEPATPTPSSPVPSSLITEAITQQEDGFNAAGATLAELKRFVRSHQPDSTTKLMGSLASRKTWQLAAEKLKQRLIQ